MIYCRTHRTMCPSNPHHGNQHRDFRIDNMQRTRDGEVPIMCHHRHSSGNFNEKDRKRSLEPEVEDDFNVFQTQYDSCTHELTVIVTTCTGLVPVQARKVPAWRAKVDEISQLMCLIDAGRGIANFINGVASAS